MQDIKMASPLYIVREQCTADLFGVLRGLQHIGFDGVEFLGFFGHAAGDVRRCLDDLGLRALGNHVTYQSFLHDMNGTLDYHAEVGCAYLTIGDWGASGFPGSPITPQKPGISGPER